MKILRVTFAVALLYLLAFAGCQHFSSHDADFESSDGVWADGTVKFKGRDFKSILWCFEAYRLKQKKEDVSIIRVTPDSPWMFLWSAKEKDDPMWNVPLGPSHGLDPYLGGTISDEEMKQVTHRAGIALDYWRKK